MADGPSNPACERCRMRRSKCDRRLPHCSRCLNAGAKCEYISRNSASVFMRYVAELESEIARLECDIRDGESPDINREQGTSPSDLSSQVFDWTQSTSPPASDDTAVTKALNSANITEIVESFSKVSLSATTSSNSFADRNRVPSPNNALHMLVFSAALPPDLLNDGDEISITTPMPPLEVASRTIERYLDDLHPSLPFISADRLNDHLRNAYKPSSADEPASSYSVFLVDCVMASTACFISPSSLPSALQLYKTAMLHFSNAASTASLGSRQNQNLLRDLEAIIAIAQFTELCYRIAPSHAIPDKLPDLWQLAGLAVRVAVDCGLHESMRPSRERALFEAAVKMDRTASEIFGGLPLAINSQTSAA